MRPNKLLFDRCHPPACSRAILNVDLSLLFTHRDTPTITLSHPRPSVREKKLVAQEDVAYAKQNDKKQTEQRRVLICSEATQSINCCRCLIVLVAPLGGRAVSVS